MCFALLSFCTWWTKGVEDKLVYNENNVQSFLEEAISLQKTATKTMEYKMDI